MQFTRPEGLEHTIPRSQAKAEKSNFLHGDLNRLSRTAVFHVDVLMNKCPASRCAYELAFFFKTQ